jgi:hypothetical protein
VLAAGRISSAFFSYKVAPVRASTIMTDLAPVAGTPPETRGGETSSRSSFNAALVFACRRGGRARVVFGGDSFGNGSGTPLGRTASCSWAKVVSANANAQKQAIQLRPNFIGGN